MKLKDITDNNVYFHRTANFQDARDIQLKLNSFIGLPIGETKCVSPIYRHVDGVYTNDAFPWLKWEYVSGPEDCWFVIKRRIYDLLSESEKQYMDTFDFVDLTQALADGMFL